MIPRPIVPILLASAILLPIGQSVLYWVGKLLAAMQDTAGEAYIGRLVLALGALWIFSIVALVLVLAIQSLSPRNDQRNSGER